VHDRYLLLGKTVGSNLSMNRSVWLMYANELCFIAQRRLIPYNAFPARDSANPTTRSGPGRKNFTGRIASQPQRPSLESRLAMLFDV